jgi:hypothetical protein
MSPLIEEEAMAPSLFEPELLDFRNDFPLIVQRLKSFDCLESSRSSSQTCDPVPALSLSLPAFARVSPAPLWPGRNPDARVIRLDHSIYSAGMPGKTQS